MPHATADMGEPSINGDLPSSQFLSHLSSYPLIHDSIDTFKKNHYGAKSIDLTNAGYSSFVAPSLQYFKGPYSYVAPYVSKADELGDKSLSKIDEKVPFVKTETKQIKSTAVGLVYWPLGKFDDGKNYAFKTYNSEHEKAGGDGLVKTSAAIWGTGVTLTVGVLQWANSFFRAKSQEAKEVTKEKTGK